MFRLSERSAATVSTRTFDVWAIAALAAARVSALRDTMTTLQPSAARISAVARPMQFEPPVIKAVLPPSFRSKNTPTTRKRSDQTMKARMICRNTPARSPVSRLNHASDAFAMADLRTKSEVMRRSFDVDRSARRLWFRGVDLEPDRTTGGRTRRRDVLRRDPLGVRDEIGELLAVCRKARRNGRIRGVLHIDVRPVGQRIEPRRLARKRRAHDGVDVEFGLPPRSIYGGQPQRADVERHTLPQSAQNVVHRGLGAAVGRNRPHRVILADRLRLVIVPDGGDRRAIDERPDAARDCFVQQV